MTKYRYWCRKYQCPVVSKKDDKWGYVLATHSLHPCFENEKGPHDECRYLERKLISPEEDIESESSS